MIKAIITDIEGTTSSLSFVKDELFPYARAHVGEFLHANANNENVIKIIVYNNNTPIFEETVENIKNKITFY
jgi:methionine salvage enolase-phosphatase E1